MTSTLETAEKALLGGDVEGALEILLRGFEELLAPSSPLFRQAIGWRQADDLCRQIGETLLETTPPPAAAGDLDLYIASQLYPGGGHTAVISDFIHASRAKETALLLTRTVDSQIYPEPIPPPEVIERTGISPENVRVCPYPGRVATVRWIADKLRQIRPRRVFLFHHPQDTPLIAALQPGIVPAAVFLVHHADRQPCAGLYTPGVRLLDLTPYTAEYSRRILQLPSLYAPLTVRDCCAGARPRFLRGPDSKLTTISSGSPHKFGPEYSQIISRVLAFTGGRHIHVGHFPKIRLADMNAALEAASIDSSRFQHVKWVPSLARAFWDLGADLMIGSMPMGGARTAIEACCAATPLLNHFPASTVRFGVQHVCPDFPLWRDPDELLELLRPVNRSWLEENGALARSHYESHHHPHLLGQAFDKLGEGTSLPLPKSVELPEDLCHLDQLERGLTGRWAVFREELPGLVALQNLRK